MRLEPIPENANFPKAPVPSVKGRRIADLRLLEHPRVFPVVLLVPVLIFFIILNVIPTLWMVGLGFYRYSPTSGLAPSFIGLHNFVDIYKNVDVWRDLGRT